MPYDAKAYKRAYYLAHREEYIARERARHAAETSEERERRLARLRDVGRRRTRKLRALVLQTYGHRCACCGETTAEFLAIDHVNGGGNKHRREIGDGQRFYGWLRDQGFPKEGFRLLCHNCNSSRGFYGSCPHEAARAGAPTARPALPQNWN